SLTVTTTWSNGQPATVDTQLKLPAGTLSAAFREAETQNGWVLHVKNAQGKTWDLAVPETSIYKFGTERGRRYFTEKVFHLLKTDVLPHLDA
ncbi:MAG: hypothetical protein V4692_05375, partial [Bdellovibrionota bacterium]